MTIWLQYLTAYNAVISITFLYVSVVCALHDVNSYTAYRHPVDAAGFFDTLGLAVCLHYLLYMVLAVQSQPEKILAVGLHEPIGDCNSTVPVHTPLGQVDSQ